ncbi:phosphohydrolase [Spirochaetia bacterium]|nr:phosphohydrolase [Spirochaetia bacterium]
MNNYPLGEIPPDSYFTHTVFLDEDFILAAPEMPFSLELLDIIKSWRFKEVFSEGEPRENYAAAENDDEEDPQAFPISDSERIKQAEEFYFAFQKYAEQLFTQLVIRNNLEFKQVAEKIKKACEAVRQERRYLLRVLKNTEPPPDQNYLTSHAVRSTIIAIIIGSYLKLPSHRLIELGVAALLHEVGMIKLSPQIYLSKRPLTPLERKKILTHPVLGYKLLNAFDFPLAVSVVALEHHERENGSGYPRKLTGNKISIYAKIIAVACSWEALSVNRPHKEAKDGYLGMLELLKNEGKQYDETVIRALVYSLSIYPIGLYVLLSNDKKAQVVDVNPENPRFPIVHILGEFTPDGKNKTLETSAEDISILRPLTREEMDA